MWEEGERSHQDENEWGIQRNVESRKEVVPRVAHAVCNSERERVVHFWIHSVANDTLFHSVRLVDIFMEIIANGVLNGERAVSESMRGNPFLLSFRMRERES